MAILTDFSAAINQIANERGIEASKIFDALKEAILVAYKREYFNESEVDLENPKEENLTVEMNPENGSFRIIARKTVVKTVKDSQREISLVDAKLIQKDLKVGDVVEIELPSDEFGRIAAQTAKQVVLQKIRESEKDAILAEFSGKTGEVFNALMQRMQRGSAVFEIGKAVAVMPTEEQIPNEFYRIGERYKVILKDIVDSIRGKELVVSRSSSDFLIALFKMEVPEIESGVVEVKAVAREAGSRSKMAVISHQEGVDPIGSCVGQRGMRIANVMSELGEEKIDIIEYSDNIEEFIAHALSPAKVESVKIKNGVATVVVAEDQLSLAIGRDGQNVRLAWKLTNMKIDIVGPDGTAKKPEPKVEVKVSETALVVEEEKSLVVGDKKEEPEEKPKKESKKRITSKPKEVKDEKTK
ncbi:transcription termination factor NusA [Candidatus Dojkabacteria bacterium]|jgi:N utilization substance protein A|nr:transcription termination factor NusA [Candidatus Dojkabacteria bacterium]